jgi:hypothetical protein
VNRPWRTRCRAHAPGLPFGPAGPVRGEPPRGEDALAALERKVRAAGAKALPAVLAVKSRSGPGYASGVIISEDGLVLSQAHVTHGLRPGDAPPAGT